MNPPPFFEYPTEWVHWSWSRYVLLLLVGIALVGTTREAVKWWMGKQQLSRSIGITSVYFLTLSICVFVMLGTFVTRQDITFSAQLKQFVLNVPVPQDVRLKHVDVNYKRRLHSVTVYYNSGKSFDAIRESIGNHLAARGWSLKIKDDEGTGNEIVWTKGRYKITARQGSRRQPPNELTVNAYWGYI